MSYEYDNHNDKDDAIKNDNGKNKSKESTKEDGNMANETTACREVKSILTFVVR